MNRPRAILLDCGSTLIHADVGCLEQRVGVSGRHLRAAFQAALAIEHSIALDEAWCLLANCPLDDSVHFAKALASPTFYRVVDHDTPSLLNQLKLRGIQLGVVANGEGQLEDELRATGLWDLFDVALDSDAFGRQKPDPTIFRAACHRMGVRGSDTWFAGDSLVNDFLGASRAGLGRSVLFDRDDVWSALPVPRVTSLAGLVAMVDAC